MSEYAERFVAHLRSLEESPGAMAALRRSVAFEPGRYMAVYPYVEPYVGKDWHERDSRRLAAYAVAGLYAHLPRHESRQTFAGAFGDLMRRRTRDDRGNEGIQKRFISLLNADPENIVEYLRQALSLMAVEAEGFDYVRLLDDLTKWMNPFPDRGEDRDRLRERWAREFYRAAETEKSGASDDTNNA
ncbi:MAG: type I-E CRISPR-associated protein Cse2/CasB [Burkholderiaceae bacterium]